MVSALDAFEYDRLYGNFANAITRTGVQPWHRSAERHAAWVRGDHDELT